MYSIKRMRAFASAVVLFFSLAFFSGTPARCQEIIIGHVAGYSGPAARDARDLGAGAQVYFDAVNERGGIAGKKIKLVAADDHYDADTTLKLMQTMAGKASAMLPMIGARNIEKFIESPDMADTVLPVVGTIPSPEPVRTSGNRNLFHIRAGDQAQVGKIIEHLTTVGITRIGVIDYKNPQGIEGINEVEQELKKHGLKPVSHGQFELAATINFEPAIKSITDNKPDALVIIGPQSALITLVKVIRQQHLTVPIYALSYLDARVLFKELGYTRSQQVVITQVLPNLRNTTASLIKDFRADFAKYNRSDEEPNSFHLEGYMSARLIVEAMRISHDTSAQGVRTGLEKMQAYDLGGYTVDFGPAKHIGSNFVTLSIVGKNGELVF